MVSMQGRQSQVKRKYLLDAIGLFGDCFAQYACNDNLKINERNSSQTNY